MKSAPSRSLQGVAEEYVEVDNYEVKVIGSPKTPNKDANTYVVLLGAKWPRNNNKCELCHLIHDLPTK